MKSKLSVQADIIEFIEFNKTNNEKFVSKDKKIIATYNAEVVDECEYFTATIPEKARFSVDWGGDHYIDEYLINESDDEKHDELSEKIDDEVAAFARERSDNLDEYYSSMSKFLEDKGFDVDCDEHSMRIVGYGFEISTTNWNHETLEDFVIEEAES